jgi:hypothetical protein
MWLLFDENRCPIMLQSISGFSDYSFCYLSAAVWNILYHMQSADRAAIYQWPYELCVLSFISGQTNYFMSLQSEVA